MHERPWKWMLSILSSIKKVVFSPWHHPSDTEPDDWLYSHNAVFQVCSATHNLHAYVKMYKYINEIIHYGAILLQPIRPK